MSVCQARNVFLELREKKVGKTKYSYKPFLGMSVSQCT